MEVNEGYARNFILKKKLGLEATAKNMNDLKLKKANEEKVAKEQLEAAKVFAEELKEKVVTVSIKTGGSGPCIWFRFHKGNRIGSQSSVKSGYR